MNRTITNWIGATDTAQKTIALAEHVFSACTKTLWCSDDKRQRKTRYSCDTGTIKDWYTAGLIRSCYVTLALNELQNSKDNKSINLKHFNSHC